MNATSTGNTEVSLTRLRISRCSRRRSVYSGIYVLNDEIIVSSYDVVAVGEEITHTLPGTAGQPVNQEITPPELPEYEDDDFTDEFDGITTGGNRDSEEDPDDEG